MEHKAARRPASSTFATVDEPEVCQTLADYHGPLGRAVLGSVLRAHLDAHVLTVTELLHSHRLLKQLLDQASLVESAVVKVATAQAQGNDTAERIRSIRAAINETLVKSRVAQLAFADLPKRRPLVEQVVAMVAAGERTPTGDVAYDLRVAIAAELATRRSWAGKFDRLNELMQLDRAEPLTMAVDGAMADILCSPAAVQELLGAPATPGGVALTLCQLVLGRTTMGSTLGPNRVGLLNAMFRQGRLTQCRAAVLDRVRRLLRAPQPLGRGSNQEAEFLKGIMAHLLTRQGVVGGAPMAEALTVRYARRLDASNDDYRLSILGIAEMLDDLFARIHYLVAIAETPIGQRCRNTVVEAVDAALNTERLIENAIVQSPDVDLVRECLVSTVDAVGRSSLPDESRVRLAGRLGSVVDDFTKRGRLVHRLRQLEPVLRRRVIRLAELATSGLMREDGAYPLLRQHILEIAKQPQFQAELAAGPSGEVAQAEVRRLCELLDRLRQSPPPSGLTQAVARAVAIARTPVDGTIATAETIHVPQPPPSARPAPASPPAPAVVPGVKVDRCPNCFERIAPSEPCGTCAYPIRIENRPGLHLPPGTELQTRYRVGRILGQGGFGATYLGWDDRLQVKVAVKEYYPSNLIARAPDGSGVLPFSDDHARSFGAGLSRFLEEARLLARLREVKEIVGVQDFFEENATAYIVMELLEGYTFKRYVAENGGRIECRRALGVLAPIAKALQTVHDQGLVHRDISPDNIFLTSTGERKLLDFGAARHAAGHDPNFTVILKPGYAPPEQYAQDSRQGPWTDVYAMCATLYCAVTGRPPPNATDRFVNDSVPRPSAIGVDLPPAFETALLKGLSMRWQDRPQSMRELLKALTSALG